MPVSLLSETETFDPKENLCREALYLSSTTAPSGRVWRNSECVVLGRFLRAEDEVHVERASADGVPVLKRTSGGGAVFHDLGNINYSIYLPSSEYTGFGIEESQRLLSYPVISVLEHLMLPWEWVLPNSIYVDGRKVSGSAQARSRGRILHHGTLLVCCDLEEMAYLLKRGGRSRMAEVANLGEFVPGMGVRDAEGLLRDSLARGWNPLYRSKDPRWETRPLSGSPPGPGHVPGRPDRSHGRGPLAGNRFR